MFNFLNTAVLAAAAAALLPFLLHLFSKRKVKIVPFSSIAYLKAMQKNQVRAIKIKQLLLLVLRTLIILAVVLAFARPATTGGYLGSHASVSAVIVIDNSASMGYAAANGLYFELAIRKARSLLEMFGPEDEIAVLATNGILSTPATERAFGNTSAANDVLDDITLTDSRANLTESVTLAKELLDGSSNLNRELYIISDFQQSSLTSENKAKDVEARTYLVDVTEGNIANNGIIDVDLGNRLIEVGTEFPLTTTIKTFASDSREDILVSLYIDGRRMSQDGIRLNAGESGQIVFPVTVSNPGFHSGSIELSDDDLLADNVRYFSFFIPDNFNILIVGNSGVDARLTELALAPDEKLRRHWSVTKITYQQLASARLNEYDVVYLINDASLASGDVNRLKNYVRNGGGLFVNVGREADSAAFNSQLSEMLGVSLTSEFPKQFSRSGFFQLSQLDLEHPILSVFSDDANAGTLSFKSYAIVKSQLNSENPARILGRFSDGSPAITVNKFGRGRTMYMGCDLNPDISDITLHPFFVPFLVRSSEFLSSGFSAATDNITTGESVRRTPGRDFNVKNEFTLIEPDSTRRIVTAQVLDDVKAIDCGRLDKAGIYRIMNGTTESDRLAVNIPVEEGDLYRADWENLEAQFNASRMPQTTNLASFVSEQRFGRELWQYFILVAILLMVLEMIVARDKGAPLSEE
ncbi:MAG: BatA domain-containing protein [Candidatus Zixiibacteriota bacterium]